MKLLTVLILCTFNVTAACTLEDFSDWEPGVVAATPLVGVPRVHGLCAMEVTGSGWVITDAPIADQKVLGRFYFYSTDGTYKIFKASDETEEIFSIWYDNGNITLDTASVSAKLNAWNEVQFIWESDNEGSLWVEDGIVSTFQSGTGAIEFFSMGVIDSNIGSAEVYFDSIELHRSTVVSSLLIGDANADENVNSGDIISIVNEFFGAGLSVGTPDCNLDGNVNSGDIICVVNKFFTN